jgi:dihydropteroate synthase
MLADGADSIDLGAESTRPGGGVYGQGAHFVPADEEVRRLLPIVTALRRASDAPLAVDTRKGSVARQALAAGADLINDVRALSDPGLAEVVAEVGCPIVLMHSRGEIPTMQSTIAFDDVVGEVEDELQAAMAAAHRAGISRDQIIVDPGIGFGKTAEQNLTLLHAASELQRRLDRPLLVGASRKSFIGRTLASAGRGEHSPTDRLGGSLAAAAWAAAQGLAMIRVHDVPETVQLLTIWRAIAAKR